MPHVPIFASEKFRGKSSAGLYGDVIAELDAGIGEVIGAIQRNGIADKTLVIFCSDNGPFLSYGVDVAIHTEPEGPHPFQDQSAVSSHHRPQPPRTEHLGDWC